MNRKVNLFLLFVLSFCFLFINYKANAIEINTSNQIYVAGAQVRTTGNAGIRFVGTINALEKNEVSYYGIMLAYGEVEISNDFILNGVINDKNVLNAEVSVLTANNQFFITLYNIPESAYSQKITARAYYKDINGEIFYSDTVITRSLEYVVTAAYLDGDRSEFVTNVYQKIEENKHTHEYSDEWTYDDINHWHQCLCGEKSDLEEHKWNDGNIILEPTFTSTGLLRKECLDCGKIIDEEIEKLVSVYQITVNLDDDSYVVDVEADGKYTLTNPVKIGYNFIKWINENEEEFAPSGIISDSVNIYPVWEIDGTDTIEELEERANAGVDCINVTGDIYIDRTIYINNDIIIYSTNSAILYRDVNFGGELFVIGEKSNGYSNILKDGTVEVSFGSSEGDSEIVLDGNESNMIVDVVGTAIFIVNGATVNIYEGVTISNHKKIGNSRIKDWADYLGENDYAGGAAIINVSGILNIYGGYINNNSVNTNITEESNISSYGGAIFNNGAFNMYGGVISNGYANRGGAICTRKIINIYKGEISSNYAENKGGAIHTTESAVCELHIGSSDAEEDTVIIKDNVAKVQAGAISSYSVVPIVIYGGVTFDGNRANGSNGGAIVTSGPITAYNSKFINNEAYEGGGAIYQYYIGENTLAHNITFENCLFEGNVAGRGGAIIISSVDEELTKSSKLTLNNCNFKSNKSNIRVVETIDEETNEVTTSNLYGSGGALYITKKTSLTIDSSIFDNNYSDLNGGSIFVTNEATATIKNSEFTYNYAKNYAGSICCASAGVVNISYTDFEYNGYDDENVTQRGGSLYLDNSSVTTSNCNFISGKASYGSAVYVSGSSSYSDNSSYYNENSNDYGAIALYGEINLTKSTFNNNVGYINGAAIYGGTNSTMNIYQCIFNENYLKIEESNEEIKRHGGAIYGINSQMLIDGSSFNLNKFELPEDITNIKAYGGAVATASNSILTINDCSFNDNESMYGGAVSLYSVEGNTFTLKNTTFEGNKSTKYGGACYINNAVALINGIVATSNESNTGGALYFSDCNIVEIVGISNFELNTASNSGGAIAISSCEDFTINGSSFNKNSSSSYGGAIHSTNNKLLIIQSSFDENNATINGGALYVNGSNEDLYVNTKECSFTKNSALGNGGAVYVTTSGIYKDCMIDNGENGSTFTSNNAANGGAIGGYGAITLDKSMLTMNTANLGGAVWVTGSAAKLNISNTTFTSNNASENGGAIEVVNGASLTDNLSQYNLNIASNNGGAIHSDSGTINITGSIFTNNEANNYAGAISLDTCSAKLEECSFSENKAAVHGGAIHLTVTKLEIIDSEFIENTTSGNGGAIYANGCSDELYLHTQSSIFTSNSSTGNGGAVYVTGSGIYYDGLKEDQTKGSTFKYNDAKNGGAIGSYGVVTLNGTLLQENTATLGGAVWMKNAASVITASEVKFVKNESTTNGGGLSLDTSNGNLYNCIFESNIATDYGGAIHMIGSDLNIESSTFTTNSATKNGGAIYVTSPVNGLCTLECTFNGNTSSANGGAIYTTGTGIYTDGSADDSAKGSTFINNSAKYGGAIGVYGVVTLYGSILTENNATSTGGAIGIYGKAYLYDTSISLNEAATSGGAIAIYEKGELTIDDSIMNENKVATTGDYTYMGGAISVAKSSCAKINNVEFNGNNGGESGGAIGVYGANAIANISDSFFSENTAKNAGAIYIGGAGIVTIDSSEFNGNIASNLGAAIYITSGSASTLNLNSATIYNNNSDKNEIGGFVYINNAANIVNIYKENVIYKDFETKEDEVITDEIWSNLIINSKNGVVNELTN